MGLNNSTLKFTRRGRVILVSRHCTVQTYSCTLKNDEYVKPHKCATTTLKDKDGKCVTLSKSGVKLVAADVQRGAQMKNLEIWKRGNDFAFCFKRVEKDEEKIYVVKVSDSDDDNELKLEEISNVEHDISNNKKHITWFRKVNAHAGDHYYIQTTSNPPKYLIVKPKASIRTRNRWSIALGDETSRGLFTTPRCQCTQEGCSGM